MHQLALLPVACSYQVWLARWDAVLNGRRARLHDVLVKVRKELWFLLTREWHVLGGKRFLELPSPSSDIQGVGRNYFGSFLMKMAPHNALPLRRQDRIEETRKHWTIISRKTHRRGWPNGPPSLGKDRCPFSHGALRTAKSVLCAATRLDTLNGGCPLSG